MNLILIFQVMLTILDEDFSVSSQMQATERRNELFYSDGYYILPPLEFLKSKFFSIKLLKSLILYILYCYV